MPVTSNSALELLQNVREWIQKQPQPLMLVTVIETVGSNPQQVGARVLVREKEFRGTVGGGKIEAAVLRDARQMLEEGILHEVRRYNLQDLGMTCGGRMDFFFERIEPAPRVWLFGGGHIAAPTAELLNKAGFRVTVIEERAEWAGSERFPDVEVVCEPYEAFVERETPADGDFVLLVTQGHSRDLVVLERWGTTPVAFFGMIGSRQKAHRARKAMLAKGMSAEEWDRIHCPVGLPLGGQHPQEIAVSIVAQMIQTRYA